MEQELIHGGVSSDSHFRLLYPIWSAARLMRSIKKLAAGEGGTSDLVLRIMTGAESSSIVRVPSQEDRNEQGRLTT